MIYIWPHKYHEKLKTHRKGIDINNNISLNCFLVQASGTSFYIQILHHDRAVLNHAF